jgi:NADPH:quinone reductase-like Zn-dependent oxidoreductase
MSDYGAVDVLAVEDIEDPQCGPGDVLVRLSACALNHFDLDLRSGVSRIPLDLPHVLGCEGVGRVEAVSPEAADRWRKGDRVMVLEEIPCGRCVVCVEGHQNLCDEGSWVGVSRQGCYAELIAVPAHAVIPLPEARTDVEWAAVQAAFGTAWHMLITRGGLRTGERVLINAVGSGIGSAALQIALNAGAEVFATAGSEAKLDRARAMGAHHAFSYGEGDWADAVQAATGGKGVDLVYDHVGGDVFVKSLSLLRPGGRLATCGAHAGESVPLDIVELFRAERTIIGSRTFTRPELETVVRLVAAGQLDPVVDSVLSIAEARIAHEKLERRDHFGKIVMTPSQPTSTAEGDNAGQA